jgi:MIP family channel proteins
LQCGHLKPAWRGESGARSFPWKLLWQWGHSISKTLLGAVSATSPPYLRVPSGSRLTVAPVPDGWSERAVAEFVGAFTLIFAGVGAIALGADLTGVALAHGLAIAVMVSAVGHISGGHFNPAITFGFLVTRRIEPMLAGVYWVAQLAGALAAALLVKWLFPGDALGRGVPSVHVISPFEAAVLEAILTFFLVWVVFATAVDPRGSFKSVAGLAIGLTISMDIFAGGRLTGAAMNPARAFGPQLAGGHWADGWVWYVGPVLGAAVAALAYAWLYLRTPPGEAAAS